MTIISKIKELKEKYPEKAALIDVKTGSRITFSQIDDKSDRICIDAFISCCAVSIL